MKKRLEILDCYRGLAAISVVLFHYTFIYRKIHGHDFNPGFDYRFGVEGVFFFFIISGFVIFYSVEKINKVSVFIKNRFFRLYPAYWVCLCITFIATLIFSSVSAPLSLKEFLVNLTMFQNWFKVKDVDGAYWSLVPELRFYLLVAIIIVLGLKDKLFITLLIWTLLSIINQVHIIYYLSAFLELNYSFFFISGIIFYKKWSGEIDKKTVALLFLNIGMALYVHSKSVGGTIVIAIAFSLFYFLLYKPGIIKGWLLKILKFLGDISFPLYLIHQVVGFIIITKLRMFFPSINSIVFVFTTIGFCIFFAYIITVFIEKPGIRFGKLLTSKLSYAEKTE